MKTKDKLLVLQMVKGFCISIAAAGAFAAYPKITAIALGIGGAAEIGVMSLTKPKE